jgi:hypothetical protein
VELAAEWNFSGAQIALALRAAIEDAALKGGALDRAALLAACHAEAAGAFGGEGCASAIGFRRLAG